MQETPSIIATCYLNEAGNEQNKIWFTQEYLQLLYKGKLKVFSLNNVRRISFNHRKLMLLLVGGGIIASLSLLAIFKSYYNPWLTLSLLTLGSLSAYKGYQGSWVLTIEEAKFQTDFFIKSITPNLKAFVRYANTFRVGQVQGTLYLPLSTDVWKQESISPGIYRTGSPLRLYFAFELASIDRSAHVILPLNSLDKSVSIIWKTEEGSGNDIFPYLQTNSTIPIASVNPV